MTLASSEIPPPSLRLALDVIGLAIWYATQALIKHRPTGTGVIGDGLHALTARLFAFLTAHPAWADRLLIVSSLGIDTLGVFVLTQSILGPSVRPFLGLFLLFGLRQICQALCALPPPGSSVRHRDKPHVAASAGGPRPARALARSLCGA